MRLINAHTWQFENFVDERRLPKYAILSHTWHDKEVQYHQMLNGQLHQDPNLDFGKESSAELTEAINSMFRWYSNSAVCYVFMSDIRLPVGWESRILPGGATYYIDHINRVMTWQHPALSLHKNMVHSTDAPNAQHRLGSVARHHGDKQASPSAISLVSQRNTDETSAQGRHFIHRRWFTRGWTLQELIAPGLLRFYDTDAHDLGPQHDVIHSIEKATGIPIDVLNQEQKLDQCSKAMRMSWAARRQTTRIEDEAYCLLGIFDVNMPLLYGEGVKAFTRLQEEIIKQTGDQSILAWDRGSSSSDILAPSVARFEHSGTIRPTHWLSKSKTYEMTRRGLRIQLRGCYIGEITGRSYDAAKYHMLHEVALLLDCVDTRKPGHYIAIKLRHRTFRGTEKAAKEISLDSHTMIYIPFQQRVWHLKPGTLDHPVGQARLHDLLLLRPAETSPRTAAEMISVMVGIESLADTSEVQGFPDAAWDKTAHELGTYSCDLETARISQAHVTKVLSLTYTSRKTLILALAWSTSETLHWDATLCPVEDASKEIAYFPGIDSLGTDWQRAALGRQRVAVPLVTTRSRSLRLSNTEKLYMQFDPTIPRRNDLGVYITLTIMSEIRWGFSTTTVRIIRSILAETLRRSMQLNFWLLVMPVMIVPCLVEVSYHGYKDPGPVLRFCAGIYSWLVDGIGVA